MELDFPKWYNGRYSVDERKSDEIPRLSEDEVLVAILAHIVGTGRCTVGDLENLDAYSLKKILGELLNWGLIKCFCDAVTGHCFFAVENQASELVISCIGNEMISISKRKKEKKIKMFVVRSVPSQVS